MVGGELYIGYTNDPYSRLREHVAASREPLGSGYKTQLSLALREHIKTERFIIAVSQDEQEARSIEASAITFFKSALNVRPEYSNVIRNFSLNSNKEINLGDKRAKTNEWFVGTTAKERFTIDATIIYDKAKKRVQAQDGYFVTYSQLEREKFNIGDKVKVNVTFSEKQKCYVAGKDTYLIPAKK
jgi:ribosomal protein L19